MAGFMHFAVLAFASGEAGGPLDVNPGLIIWTSVTFIILLFLLKKFAWKPILNSLNERESFITNSLERAEQAQKEAEELLMQNQANLAKAEEEAQKIIKQGREYADSLKDQILEESKKDAQKMIQDASAEIEQKNREAFNNLKAEIADIAVNAAEKILRETLDSEKQKKLVEKYIQDISKN
ncbi:atp synthase b chain [hydrocarbon metagenome]|uniref:Atp synthase b chain n=1 Tax=hydrocarbon metagenome TaxID=938273 RepID=A0A0W8G103_9ZZZZ